MTDFFPKGTFHDRSDFDEFVRVWYVKHLKASKELPLTINYVEGSERYRFIWLRTFDQPIIIRIEMHDGKASLTAKVLSGKGGYEPGTIIEEISRNVSPEEWKSFKSLLVEADYWNITNSEFGAGLDGAQWVMESISEQGYYLVDLFCPYIFPPFVKFVEACFYLVGLSGININPDDIY
jgi:hypothetical protein